MWRTADLGEVVQLVLEDYGNALCGLRDDGTIACIPSAGDKAESVRVIPNIADAISLGYGSGQFCALRANKNLECWTTRAATGGWTPQVIAENVVEAERSGGAHCYRQESGAQACSASSSKGYVSAVPVQGPLWKATMPAFAWDEAVDYTGRYSLECIRDGAGVVKCWGSNEHGELGNGRSAYSAEPRTFFDAVDDAQGIALGGQQSCVRRAEGGLACVEHRWSWDTPEVAGVRALRVGAEHACAIVGGGQLRCWGDNMELALGVEGEHEGLVAVPGLSNIAHIGAGDGHTCAASLRGDLHCWGGGEYGQLGDGRHMGMSEYEDADGMITSHRPVKVSGVLGAIRDLALGDGFSCAATGTGLYCWGSIADAAGGEDPAYATPELIWAGELKKIRAAGSSLCGLDGAGVVRCAGEVAIAHVGEVDRREEYDEDEDDAYEDDESEDDEYGDEFSVRNPFPEGGPMWRIAGGPRVVTDIAVGVQHACVLAAEGTVHCWGENGVGELGDGSSRQRTGLVKVGSLADVVEIDAGTSHTCARRKDGTIACWGSWTGDKADAASKTPVPVVGITPYLLPGMVAEEASPRAAKGG